MPAERTCPRCGTPLSCDALEGLCPACVGRAAFADASASEEAGDARDSAPSPEVEADLARLKPEEAGERIGNYKLLEQIGQGGFGTVWVAEQERPVHRRVALKIIKLGMDTKEVIARFEQERQALALMDHPHIAKVFDAGATQWGRPFFVMELVRGINITDYCDHANLPTAERLALFIQVCNAVQHAHQKGIIHRDLKPSNILVTLHDGVPVPKVIDFGVAKAMQKQRLTDLTIYTQFQQMIGTPLYMSPEQAEMSGIDIDTRSDIYSLGVLLYELLTGRTPFDPGELMRKAHDEIRRVIREQDPQTPSMFVHTMAADIRANVALHRQSDPAKLAGFLRGDLDWIVMKALEKDRVRRYETAKDLAADIERHLATEPVHARPASRLYRFQKLIRRNKFAFAAGSAVVAAVLIGLTVSIWQAVRAREAEQLATQRLDDVEAVSNYLIEIFRSPDPTRDGRTITVAETLDRAVKKLENDLSDQPERRARLRGALGRTYTALGLSHEAIPLEEKARDHCLKFLGPEHPDTLRAMHNLAISYSFAGRREEALKLREEVLTFRRKVLGPEHPDTLMAMGNLAFSYRDAGHREEALKLEERILSLRSKALGPEHSDTLMAMGNLALSYRDAGRREEALKLGVETLRLFRKVNGPEHPDTLRMMNNLAVSYEDLGRGEEALKLREEALTLCRKVFGPEHPITLLAMANLANSSSDTGRRDEALTLREEALMLSRKVLGPEHPDTLMAIDALAGSYRDAGRRDEALKMREEVLPLCRKVLGPEHLATLWVMSELAVSRSDAARWEDALKLREEVLTISRKVLVPEHPDTVKAMGNLAASYYDVGRRDEALKLREEVLTLSRKVLGPEHPETLKAMGNLAGSYHDASRRDEALKLREEVLTLSRKVNGPEHPARSGQ